MKTVFFELEGWEESIVREKLPGFDIVIAPGTMEACADPQAFDAEIAVVFVDSRVTGEVLAKFPNLKFVATRSTGYDHIDLAACKARGIRVAFVPGYGDNTVAEFAFGLILNLTRNIYQAIDRVKETRSFSLEGLRGTDIKGKTLGVIGAGRIGREAIRIGKGFGMRIVAYDLKPDAAKAVDLGFEYLGLPELLAASDVITIHCPYTPETRHLLNQSNLSAVKRGAYLVNTARGGIVETAALIEALKNGTLAGAALDVVEEEGEMKDEMKFLSANPHADDLKTILENHALMSLPNVLVTPHNAFNSKEALERILGTTLSNIESFAKGSPFAEVPESR